MSPIFSAALHALAQVGITPIPDPDHQMLNVLAPAPQGEAGTLLFSLRVDEDAQEVTVFSAPTLVPPAGRVAVALLLAELNTRYKAVTFGLMEDRVVVDSHVELAFTDKPEAMIALGFSRLTNAVGHAYPELVAAVRVSGPAPQWQVELEHMLEEAD